MHVANDSQWRAPWVDPSIAASPFEADAALGPALDAKSGQKASWTTPRNLKTRLLALDADGRFSLTKGEGPWNLEQTHRFRRGPLPNGST